MHADVPSSLRIAHVNSEKGFSGGEAQMFLLMRGLRERGHHNLVISRPGSRCTMAAREQGFEVVPASMGNDLDLSGLLEVRRALRQWSPDIVNLHTGRATWLGGLAAWSAGFPALTTRRMDKKVRRGPRAQLIYSILTRRVAAVSPAVVELLQRGGVAKERIELICDAVEPEALRAGREAADVRAELGADEGRPVLLVLASLVHRKGIDVLIDALALLRKEAPQLNPLLWIAGSGPEEGNLRSQINSVGASDSIRLLGQRNDAPDLLNACDLLVLPSRREGLGVAALEAMAVGKPVIASRVGGLAQAVEHRQTGLLVPAGDAHALSEAIRELLSDSELFTLFARNGPARIEETFLGSDQVLRYERLYGEILEPETRSAINAI